MDMDDWFEVKVAKRWQEAVDVACFELVPTGEWVLPPFEPGAHIDVCTPAGPVRSYSLCNAPTERNRYVIAVLLERAGLGGSRALHDQVRPGSFLKIRTPRNEFHLHRSVPYSVFLAGGIGIAPLMGMAETLWLQGGAFELHYGARNPDRAPFAKALAKCAFSSRVRTHWSEEQGRLPFNRVMGRISTLSHVYVCGPSGFIESVVTAARQNRVAMDRVHFERFRPNEALRVKYGADDAQVRFAVEWSTGSL